MRKICILYIRLCMTTKAPHFNPSFSLQFQRTERDEEIKKEMERTEKKISNLKEKVKALKGGGADDDDDDDDDKDEEETME